MSIAFVANRGLGVGGGIAASVLLCAWAVTTNVGAILIQTCYTDNLSGTDGNTNDHVSMTDGGGNTWTKLYEWSNANGGAGNGLTTSMWMLSVAVVQTGGATSTLTLSGSLNDRLATQHEFSVGAGKTLQVAGTIQTGDTDGSNDFSSLALSGLPSKEYLFFRLGGKEANSLTAMTASAGWTLGQNNRSRNNALAVLGQNEYLISTATGATSAPTLAVVGDTSSILVALEEVSIPTPTYRPRPYMGWWM